MVAILVGIIKTLFAWIILNKISINLIGLIVRGLLGCVHLTVYTLDVPEDSVITYIDDIMWNCILGKRPRLTPRYRRRIEDEAANMFPNDSCKRQNLEKKLENKFWDKLPPVKELWESLLLNKAVDGSPALIKHPIPDRWIIECETVQYYGHTLTREKKDIM